MMTLRSFFSEPRIDSYSAMLLARHAQFLGDFVDGEPGQAMQLQFEDRVRLNAGERLFRIDLRSASGDVDVDLLAGEVGDQVFAGFGAVGAGADDGDHVVEVIERDQVAFENVLAVFAPSSAGKRCGGGPRRRGGR